MANSADPDQLAFQKPTDLDHSLQSRVYPGSAGQGLNVSICTNHKKKKKM